MLIGVKYKKVKINSLMLFIVVLSTFFITSCIKEEDEIIQDKETGPKSQVDIHQTISSTILGQQMNYSVYFPKGYDSSEKEYPVLYLLHGMNGNHIDWITQGMVNIMDMAIEGKEAKEMLVVMPNAFNTFYCNNFNGNGLKYKDYFFEEFIPEVEKRYRIKKALKSRAISGVSMGGYGATYLAFSHPELFCYCYSMSGAVIIDGSSAPDIRDVINEKLEEENKVFPTYFMDCGTEDFLFPANIQFDAFLDQKEIGHTFITRPGTHEWGFWRVSLKTVAKGVSEIFE